MSIRRKRKCRLGKVRSGARKGLCRKVRPGSRRRRSRSCPLGRVKTGARKGRCRKVRVRSCVAFAPYMIGGKPQYRCSERSGNKHTNRPSPNRLSGPSIPAGLYRQMQRARKAAHKEAVKAARAARKAGGTVSSSWRGVPWA